MTKEYLVIGLIILTIILMIWYTVDANFKEVKRLAEEDAKEKMLASLRLDDASKDAKIKELTSRDQELVRQVENLEQRVRVLERIVTDRGTVLASEIEALRETTVT